MQNFRKYNKSQLKEMEYSVDRIKSDMNSLIFFFLWFFGGIFGLPNYYARRYLSGVAFTFAIGFFFIGWDLDLFLMLFDSLKDDQGFLIVGNRRKQQRYTSFSESQRKCCCTYEVIRYE